MVCLGSTDQRMLELLDRAIRLVRVVVGDAEVGRHVGVGRLQLQRVLVPRDGVGVLLGVEVDVAQLDAGGDVLRDSVRQWSSAPARGSGRAALPASRHPLVAPRRSAAGRPAWQRGPHRSACWLPRIQPTIRPNRVPAMAKTIDSARIFRAALRAGWPPSAGTAALIGREWPTACSGSAARDRRSAECRLHGQRRPRRTRPAVQNTNVRRSQSTRAGVRSGSAVKSAVPCARTALSRCSRPPSGARQLAHGPKRVRILGARDQPDRAAAELLDGGGIQSDAAIVERRRDQRHRADAGRLRGRESPPASRRARRRRAPLHLGGRCRGPRASRPPPARHRPSAPRPRRCRAELAVAAQIDREDRDPGLLQPRRRRRPIRPSIGPACARARRPGACRPVSYSVPASDVPSAAVHVTLRPAAASGSTPTTALHGEHDRGQPTAARLTCRSRRAPSR